MARHITPGVLIAAAALLLCGCTLIQPPLTPSSPPTSASPSPAASLITAEQMLSAPVPSLCDHPAGTLANGELDAPGDNTGGAMIAQFAEGDWKSLSFHSWLGADGGPYAALVMDCNQGGVAWPPHVVFYSAGPTVLGEIDVAKIVGNGRQSVQALEPTTNGIRLSLTNTYQKGEDGCCGTTDSIADFTWNGSVASGGVIKSLNEKVTAKDAFFAALKGDQAAIKKLYNAEGLSEAMEFKDAVYINDPSKWSTDFHCDSATNDQLFEGNGRDYDRVCYFGAKKAYVAAFVAMKHTGFGTWEAAGVQFTSTD